MDISIKDLGACKKELMVVIPAEEVDAELEKALEGVRGQVALPGFRQGKVPRSLIERKFGREVAVDVANDLFGKAVEKAVEQHKLEIVSDPEVATPPPPPELGKQMSFTFQVEVKPTFDLPEYKGLKATKTIKSVNDAEVDNVIADMRERRAVLKPIPGDAGFAAGDYGEFALVIKKGDTVLHDLDDVTLGGKNPRLRSFNAPTLAAALLGKKPGDAFVVDAMMDPPHDHDHDHHDHDHDHDGDHHDHDHPPAEKVPVKLEFRLKELKRRELPEVDDAFAQEVGEQTVLGMRVAVRKRLAEAHARAAEKEVEQSLIDQLVDRAQFEMAKGPVDRAVKHRAERLVLERMVRGQEEGEARAAVEAEMDTVRRIVERDAKAWLLVERVAKKEKIFALEDDVAKEIARIAEAQGTTPTKIRESYEAEGVIAELRADVLERKVLDFLRSHGTVTEVQDEGTAKKAAGEEGA